MAVKALLVLYSFHHHNTEKVADILASVLDAEIQAPRTIDPDELQRYDLIGFGSGIYSDQHHQSLLTLADRLPPVTGRKTFLFSTCGVPAFAFDGGAVDDYVERVHTPLRERLASKGYRVVGEFICPGWNTNKFLKLFGGLNRGRPNAQDLKRVEAFAQRLTQGASDARLTRQRA
jgi:flavodoxin